MPGLGEPFWLYCLEALLGGLFHSSIKGACVLVDTDHKLDVSGQQSVFRSDKQADRKKNFALR